jgi:hypothetical protein
VTDWPRDELVEARADAILAGVHTVEAYAEHFEAQMRAGTFEAQMRRGLARKLLAPLRVFRRKGVILLLVILAPIGLLGYAAATTDMAPAMVCGANGVAAVNHADEVTLVHPAAAEADGKNASEPAGLGPVSTPPCRAGSPTMRRATVIARPQKGRTYHGHPS